MSLINLFPQVSTTYLAGLISADAWVGEMAPFTQQVTINGLYTTDVDGLSGVHIAPDYTGDPVVDEAISIAWSQITFGKVTAENIITFTARAEKPMTDIKISMEVIR